MGNCLANNDVDNCTIVFGKKQIIDSTSLNEPVLYNTPFNFIYYILVDCCVTINFSKTEVDCCIFGSLVNGPGVFPLTLRHFLLVRSNIVAVSRVRIILLTVNS